MPTYGWGDDWGGMPWGGSTESTAFTGSCTIIVLPTNERRTALSGSCAVTVTPTSSSRVDAKFTGSCTVSVSASHTRTTNAVFSGSSTVNVIPTNTRRITVPVDGTTVSVTPSNTRRIARNGSVTVVVTPTSTYRTIFGYIGNTVISVIPSHSERHETVFSGRSTITVTSSVRVRGWIRRFGKEAIYRTVVRPSGIWTRQSRPTTIFQKVAR